MEHFQWLPALFAVLLAIIHVFGYRLTFLQAIPRSKWLSMAGGISVGYVFVHLLPELQEFQEHINTSTRLDMFVNHTYCMAMLGLVGFYGIERAVKVHDLRKKERPTLQINKSIFWVHITSFATYNALIGYLLVHRESDTTLALVLFFVAMAFHFFVNDYGLLANHEESYLRIGRWIVSGAVLAGWLLGLFTTISETVLAFIFSFLAGAIVLNVLKEELPEERKSNFWAFLIGALAYSLLLIFSLEQ